MAFPFKIPRYVTGQFPTTKQCIACQSVGGVAKRHRFQAESLRFDSLAGQIVHDVANESPLLRCFFGAVLSRR